MYSIWPQAGQARRAHSPSRQADLVSSLKSRNLATRADATRLLLASAMIGRQMPSR